MKNVLKRIWIVSLFLLLTLSCSNSANAATQKQKALKAYADYMASQPAKKEGSTVQFGLAYVDSDSIPELVKLYRGMQGLQVFTYANGKVQRILNTSYMGFYGFTYYPKKGIYCDTGSESFPVHDYYILKNGKASELFSYFDEGEEFSGYYKYSAGKEEEISKSVFQKLLKQYVGSTKSSKCKYYNNTSANRKKYLGYSGSIPASIKLNKSQGSIYAGKSVQLKATVTGNSKKATWKSSNTKVAVVNSSGKVTGKKAGTATITAKANGKTAICRITVKNSTIKLNKSTAVIYTSGTTSVQLKATVQGASSKVTWKSSNTKIAAVSSSGKVTAKKAGTVTITAKANGKTAKCKVTVKVKNNKSSVNNLYREFLKKNIYTETYYSDDFLSTYNYYVKNCYFTVLDINKDGIADLVMGCNKDGKTYDKKRGYSTTSSGTELTLFTVKENKVVHVGSLYSGMKPFTSVGYSSKYKAIHTHAPSTYSGSYAEHFATIKNGKIVWIKDFYWSKYPSLHYTIDGKKVSEATYLEQRNLYIDTVKCINMAVNNEANRSKYLK